MENEKRYSVVARHRTTHFEAKEDAVRYAEKINKRNKYRAELIEWAWAETHCGRSWCGQKIAY